MPLRRVLGAALCAGLIGTTAGCGGSHPKSSAAHSSSAPVAAAAEVRTARCMLWNVLDRPARLRLVRGLRDFFSQPVDNGAHEQVIPDDQAYTGLTRYCRLPLARGFLLYRLYGNASAFGSVNPQR